MDNYYLTAASLLSAMDPSADPCEDFYQFACGTWDKRHLIPEDKSSINTFEVLADRLQVILKGQILNTNQMLYKNKTMLLRRRHFLLMNNVKK